MATTIRAMSPYVTFVACETCFSTPVKRPSNRATSSFSVPISAFMEAMSALIGASSLVSSLVTSSLTIKRILSRSASVSSPSAGSAIAEKSIKRTSMVFMGCSSVSPFIPLQRWEGGRHALRQALQCHPKLDTHIIQHSGVKRQVVFDSRRPYRERHDLKTYVQLKIPAPTTRTVAIQSII